MNMLDRLRIWLTNYIRYRSFTINTEQYWNRRYGSGATSGSGSYGEVALWKASIVNEVIEKLSIKSVVEYGCGDGNQLSLYHISDYLGLDISEYALEICKKKFENDATKVFQLFSGEAEIKSKELAICIEVLMHILEDDLYEKTIKSIFSSGHRYVLLCTPLFRNSNFGQGSHERDRNLFVSILKYIPSYRLIDVKIYPKSSLDDRNNQVASEIDSDFLLFERCE